MPPQNERHLPKSWDGTVLVPHEQRGEEFLPSNQVARTGLFVRPGMPHGQVQFQGNLRKLSRQSRRHQAGSLSALQRRDGPNREKLVRLRQVVPRMHSVALGSERGLQSMDGSRLPLLVWVQSLQCNQWDLLKDDEQANVPFPRIYSTVLKIFNRKNLLVESSLIIFFVFFCWCPVGFGYNLITFWVVVCGRRCWVLSMKWWQMVLALHTGENRTPASKSILVIQKTHIRRNSNSNSVIHSLNG